MNEELEQEIDMNIWNDRFENIDELIVILKKRIENLDKMKICGYKWVDAEFALAVDVTPKIYTDVEALEIYRKWE